MDDADTDALLIRYGTRSFYEDSFENIGYLEARKMFRVLELTKTQAGEDYEHARQQFLKLLGHHKAPWFPTSRNTDYKVEISKLSKHENRTIEYLAYMRLRPGGFRGERIVADNMEIVFHLLIGRAIMTCRKRVKIISRGSHFTIPPKSTFSIKCCGSDQDAYFVFKILLHRKTPREPCQQSACSLQVIPHQRFPNFRVSRGSPARE